MKLRHSIILPILFVATFIGAGCTEYSNPSAVTATQISALDYYNTIIQQTNTLNNQIDFMVESLASAKDQSNDIKKMQYTGYDSINGSMTSVARSMTIDVEGSVDIDAETKKQLDDLLREYYDKTDQAGMTFEKLSDYSEREAYKDDNGEQFTVFEKELQTQLDELVVVQTKLSDFVNEKQDGIDLGLDENSTDPVEVGSLAIDTLTQDAENAHTAAIDWLDAYIETGEKGNTDAMMTAFDTLKADYHKYKEKTDAVDVKSLTFAGREFSTYMESINTYMNEYEVVLRDIKNNEFEGAAESIGSSFPLTKGLGTTYNENIVKEHNSLISLFESDAR